MVNIVGDQVGQSSWELVDSVLYVDVTDLQWLRLRAPDTRPNISSRTAGLNAASFDVQAIFPAEK